MCLPISRLLAPLLLLVVACGAGAQNISIATGGTGGVYYSMGGGIAAVLSKYVPGMQATAEVTGGSVDNLKLIGSGKQYIGFAMTDASLDAYHGEDKFKGNKIPLRTLMILYPNRMHVVTVEGRGIAKMSDLRASASRPDRLAARSEVSPPTALSPFAAAAITGGDPYKTTMQCWKYTVPAFLLPFMFVLDPAGQGLLLMGSTKALADANWWSIAQVTLTAALGIAAIAGGFQGWALRRANMLERAMLIVAGVALVYPGGLADAIGLTLIVAVLAMQRFLAAPGTMRAGEA